MATLADNHSGRFIDRWVRLRVPQDTNCVWFGGLQAFDLPIAHGEGRFVPESDEALGRWRRRGQVALAYDGDNPNGSVADIAGICDPSGLVLGLMPHPERCVHSTQRPDWTSPAQETDEVPAGLRMFQNAVQHVERAAEPSCQGTAER